MKYQNPFKVSLDINDNNMDMFKLREQEKKKKKQVKKKKKKKKNKKKKKKKNKKKKIFKKKKKKKKKKKTLYIFIYDSFYFIYMSKLFFLFRLIL